MFQNSDKFTYLQFPLIIYRYHRKITVIKQIFSLATQETVLQLKQLKLPFNKSMDLGALAY